MSTDATKAMEDALKAAVNRLNGHESGTGSGAGADPIGLLTSILSRLASHDDEDDERDEVLEKLEGVQREELVPLRDEVRELRKAVHRALKLQHATLVEVRELAAQGRAVGEAVLELARHMARVQIIEDLPGEAPGKPVGGSRSGARADPARGDPGARKQER